MILVHFSQILAKLLSFFFTKNRPLGREKREEKIKISKGVLLRECSDFEWKAKKKKFGKFLETHWPSGRLWEKGKGREKFEVESLGGVAGFVVNQPSDQKNFWCL